MLDASQEELGRAGTLHGIYSAPVDEFIDRHPQFDMFAKVKLAYRLPAERRPSLKV